MLPRTVIAAAAALVVVGLLAPSPAVAHHHAAIQPGAQMTSPSGCTFNFVFRDAADAWYIGTAAHCVSFEGQTVSADGIGGFGSVVWRSNSVDFALIAIHPSFVGQIDPALRHRGGPTGVAIAQPDSVPRFVFHYGYGIGYGETEPSRARPGLLTVHTPTYFLAQTTATFGDSGSALITEGGLALGVISEFALFEAHTDRGPTIERILQRALAEKGLDLRVETAPLTDAAARELERAGHAPLA